MDPALRRLQELSCVAAAALFSLMAAAILVSSFVVGEWLVAVGSVGTGAIGAAFWRLGRHVRAGGADGGVSGDMVRSAIVGWPLVVFALSALVIAIFT